MKCPICGKSLADEMQALKAHLFSPRHEDGAEVLRILSDWASGLDDDEYGPAAQKGLMVDSAVDESATQGGSNA